MLFHRGNSFWRMSRFLESQALSISSLDAQLHMSRKQRCEMQNPIQGSSHITIAIIGKLPQRDSQILPCIVSLWIHSQCPNIVTNWLLIHALCMYNCQTYNQYLGDELTWNLFKRISVPKDHLVSVLKSTVYKWIDHDFTEIGVYWFLPHNMYNVCICEWWAMRYNKCRFSFNLLG